MTREEIIRTAREADFGFYGGPDEHGIPRDSLVGMKAITRFAALIEQRAAAAEREACAKIVDANAAACANNSMLQDVLRGNAAAIRARGE